jgi:hypothetical protein
MAATQIKPTSGGSWQNTGHPAGKSVTGISNLGPAYVGQVLEAANLFTFAGGTAGNSRVVYAGKLAAAAGRQFQWA